jgi:uncharacterized protein YcnI
MKHAFWRVVFSGLAFGFAIAQAQAHVRVSPAEAKPASTQIYMVTIPTEGKVATTRTELVLPAGVTLISVDQEGKPFDVQHPGDGTTIIVWRTEIPPGWAKMFHFTVSNPATASEIAWKAHQYFADGSVADWTGEPGSKRPASVTTLRP